MCQEVGKCCCQSGNISTQTIRFQKLPPLQFAVNMACIKSFCSPTTLIPSLWWEDLLCLVSEQTFSEVLGTVLT